MNYTHKDIHDAYDEGYQAALDEQDEWLIAQRIKCNES